MQFYSTWISVSNPLEGKVLCKCCSSRHANLSPVQKHDRTLQHGRSLEPQRQCYNNAAAAGKTHGKYVICRTKAEYCTCTKLPTQARHSPGMQFIFSFLVPDHCSPPCSKTPVSQKLHMMMIHIPPKAFVGARGGTMLYKTNKFCYVIYIRNLSLNVHKMHLWLNFQRCKVDLCRTMYDRPYQVKNLSAFALLFSMQMIGR